MSFHIYIFKISQIAFFLPTFKNLQISLWLSNAITNDILCIQKLQLLRSSVSNPYEDHIQLFIQNKATCSRQYFLYCSYKMKQNFQHQQRPANYSFMILSMQKFSNNQPGWMLYFSRLFHLQPSIAVTHCIHKNQQFRMTKQNMDSHGTVRRQRLSLMICWSSWSTEPFWNRKLRQRRRSLSTMPPGRVSKTHIDQ